jgi:hypothetical protein
MTHTPAPWHKCNTSNDQGLIIQENTGENIAVTYEAKNAALVAAAPELLEACKAALSALESHQAYDKDMRPVLRAAISLAEGE